MEDVVVLLQILQLANQLDSAVDLVRHAQPLEHETQQLRSTPAPHHQSARATAARNRDLTVDI
eukprot:6934397-Pyramimonas_sp.AAC.2